MDCIVHGVTESDPTEQLSLSLFNSDMDHVVTVDVGRLDLEKTYCRQQKWMRTVLTAHEC